MSVVTEATRPSAELNSSGPANDRATRISAFVVRMTVALLWLENLSWKVPPDFGSNNDAGLYHFTRLAVEYPVLAPYSALVENVVLPNFTVFAWGVYITEICLGVFLVLGLATRFWALVGVAQAVAIFLSLGAAPNEWKWSYFLMMAAHVAVLGFAAGRVWGLDSVVRRRIAGRRHGVIAKAYLIAS